MERSNKLLYIAIDGDGIGRKVGRAVLENNSDKLHAISARIDAAQNLMMKWAKEHGGKKISGGGDESMMTLPEKNIGELESLRESIENAFDFTVSCGVGKTLSEAGKALLIAKIKGKNRIEFFNKNTESQIKQIKKRAKKGAIKSLEEYKLAEAYLNKAEEDEISSDNCPYCEQTDGVDTEHCKWCHELEEQQQECPYCKGSQENPAHAPQAYELAEQDCAFCKEKDQKEKEDCVFCENKPTSLVSPDSNNEIATSDSEEEMYDRMDMNPPEIKKPGISEEPPIGMNPPMDNESDDEDLNQNLKNSREIPEEQISIENENLNDVSKEDLKSEDNHSREVLEAIAEKIKQEETPLRSKINDIGDEDVDTGSTMEENISRPEGFFQSSPGDMGQDGANIKSHNKEDVPNFKELLQEGLDKHAGSVKKEKTIKSVFDALQKFKVAKVVLEQNREQMPELYDASISMLKAMAEMAKLLKEDGDVLLGEEEQESGSELGEEQQNLEGEFQDVIEEQGSQPIAAQETQEEAQPQERSEMPLGSANEEGMNIGQGIKKLPTKETTKHVSRTVLPIGAVNSKGQKKVLDNEGNVRFISMKQGMVMGPSGVPIKP